MWFRKKPHQMTEDEIVDDLIKKIPALELDMLGVMDEEDLIHLHMTTGAVIRNEYALWKREWEPEEVDGVDISPNHPDAVSDRIIHRLWERSRL